MTVEQIRDDHPTSIGQQLSGVPVRTGLHGIAMQDDDGWSLPDVEDGGSCTCHGGNPGSSELFKAVQGSSGQFEHVQPAVPVELLAELLAIIRRQPA
jgi:hypothetical protein